MNVSIATECSRTSTYCKRTSTHNTTMNGRRMNALIATRSWRTSITSFPTLASFTNRIKKSESIVLFLSNAIFTYVWDWSTDPWLPLHLPPRLQRRYWFDWDHQWYWGVWQAKSTRWWIEEVNKSFILINNHFWFFNTTKSDGETKVHNTVS